MKHEQDKVITEGEVADMLGLSGYQTQQLRKRGEGPPYVRIGGRYYYKTGAVLEWWDSLAGTGGDAV